MKISYKWLCIFYLGLGLFGSESSISFASIYKNNDSKHKDYKSQTGFLISAPNPKPMDIQQDPQEDLMDVESHEGDGTEPMQVDDKRKYRRYYRR